MGMWSIIGRGALKKRKLLAALVSVHAH